METEVSIMRLITDDLPAVIQQEQIPAQPGYVFEVCLEGEEAHVVQFFSSLAMWKWVGWSYQQVRAPDRRRFEAKNTPHRISPGLYRLPVSYGTALSERKKPETSGNELGVSYETDSIAS
jgi:hypothetical protein